VKGRRFCRLCWLFLFSVLTLPQGAESTSLGSIEGIVSDPSGAVIPGATARAHHLTTGVMFNASTNNEGLFWFPAAPVGTYELMVEKPGFAAWIQKDVRVTVGARVSLTVSLSLATAERSVVVQAENYQLETTRSQVSTTIESRAITGLPINGRSFVDFVLLTPGVTGPPSAVPGSGGSPSFEGQRLMYSLLVDGTDNNNTFFGEALGFGAGHNQYSLDTVQEFQVNLNSYSAEMGRAGGGVINTVTKSGTKDFHGGAFEYYRDRSLNADDLINKLNDEPKSPYHFNQFGGSLGGPIRRKRAFFFLGYEGQRNTAQNVVTLNLPAGFKLSPDPSVAAFQQRALDYLTARSSSWLSTFNQDLFFLKGDWLLSPHHALTARWNRQRFDGEGMEKIGPQIAMEHTGATQVATDTLVVELTSTLSPAWVNVARWSHAQYDLLGRANSSNPEANIFESGQLVLSIGRNPTSPREIALSRLEWSDTLSHSAGDHLLKAGFDFLQDWITFFTPVNFSGSYRFKSLESFGRSVAGMPAPLPGEQYIQAFSGNGTPGTTVHPNIFEYTGFVEDEWRVAPELTFNLGLRYDSETLARPPVRNPSSALAARALDTSFVPEDYDNFAPRLGFAWVPLRNRSLIVRGGYGIFYARTPSSMSSRAHFQNGLTVQTRTFLGGAPTAGLIPAYPNTLCGPPNPSGIPPSCAAPTSGAGASILMMFDPRYAWPMVHQSSFGIELPLTKDTALSASYLWVHGTHLQRVRDINLGTPVSATIPIADSDSVLSFSRFPSPRPISDFDRIFLFESSASSIYNGLALQITRRFENHFQFMGSYTWSKVIDDNPESTAVNPPASDARLLSDPSDPRSDRSRGVTDQRHRFVFSGIWDLDYTRRHSGFTGAILGDWQVGSILTAQSGLPYSGLINFDLNNDGNFASDRTPGLGRNTFTLPTTVALDTRLTRMVPLKSDRARLQLSGEAFNLFNRANVIAVRTQQYAVSGSVAVCGPGVPQCLEPLVKGLSAFGTPTATSGPRILQLVARVVF
jgi:outer membrane receptor protein involved in Fe transport